MPSSAAAGETTGGWCTAGSARATGGDPAVLRAPVVGPAPGVSSALPSSARAEFPSLKSVQTWRWQCVCMLGWA
eukprot:scaffold42711_cov60-Phaeocystis_antarctica.AAC.1